MRSTTGIGSRCLRNFASGIAVASLALIYQPVKIEGNSMTPLLSNHEAIVINRLVYHFEPLRRGDVIVFRYPLDATKSYIKRIVGLPGETSGFTLPEAVSVAISVNSPPLGCLPSMADFAPRFAASSGEGG